MAFNGKLDPNYSKPRPAGTIHRPSCTEGSFVAPARGDEFLMPIQSFFCSLCCEYSKDSTSAEAHLKSREHNAKFKGFLKDNPSYEMQFLRGKMLAVQKAMECRDALLQTSEEQVVADPDKCLSAVKKETECSKSTAPNGQQQPVSSDTQKRKVDEVPPDTEVKRIKISATLKTDCKPDMSKTSIPDKDTKKIVVKPDIKDNKIDTSEVEDEIKRTVNKPVEAKSEMVKGSMTKKSVKAVPDKPDKSSWTSRDRTPERYRDKFDQRSRNRRDSPDRWKSGSRDDWGSDRKRLSPKRQLGPRKISPAIYRPQEDKKRSSASRAKEEKSKDVEVVHIKDSPSPKRETPKEGSGKGYSTLPSPSSIPLPEKPVSRLIAPFSLRNSKLVKSQQKPAGAMQADRSTISEKFNVQDFEVLDECGDA